VSEKNVMMCNFISHHRLPYWKYRNWIRWAGRL